MLPNSAALFRARLGGLIVALSLVFTLVARLIILALAVVVG
jgi:hypothetical protein